MIWCKYTPWKVFHQVNKHIHHLTYLPLCVCVCVCEEHLNCTLSKFQLHNTVLSTITTMLHIRSSNLIHVSPESLYPFIKFSLFFPPPQAPENHPLLSGSMNLNFFLFSFPFLDSTHKWWASLVALIVKSGLVAKSCPTLETPWTIARQAPLSMGFSRQEYWSGLPFPSPGWW